jgi:hypothetical protein
MEAAMRKGQYKEELQRLVNRLRQIRRYKEKKNRWGREPNSEELEWEQWEWEEDERRKRVREGKPPHPRDVAKEEARMQRLRGAGGNAGPSEEEVETEEMDDWLTKLIDQLYEEQQKTMMLSSNPSDPCDCDQTLD